MKISLSDILQDWIDDEDWFQRQYRSDILRFNLYLNKAIELFGDEYVKCNFKPSLEKAIGNQLIIDTHQHSIEQYSNDAEAVCNYLIYKKENHLYAL